ncbi:MAG: helical backbone metal receptor [Bacteroidota bacterium]
MMYRISLLIILALLVSCQNNSQKKLISEAPLISQTYTDGLGRKIQLSDRPQRIISLAPNITEIIYAIGAEDKLVARTQACDYPQEVFSLAEVTTFPAIDLEQIRTLRPDLILATNEIFGPDDIAQLERVGAPVYIQVYQKMSDIYDGMEALGKVFDVADQAKAIADSLRALDKRVTQATEGQIPYSTLLLTSSGDPLQAVGGKGYLNELIQKAGGKNIFADIDKPYASVDPESILLKKPEYLILPSTNDQVYQQLIGQYPSLYNTEAEKLKQVFVVNPDIYYRPGPRTLDALLDLTQILHTQLNRESILNAE